MTLAAPQRSHGGGQAGLSTSSGGADIQRGAPPQQYRTTCVGLRSTLRWNFRNQRSSPRSSTTSAAPPAASSSCASSLRWYRASSSNSRSPSPGDFGGSG